MESSVSIESLPPEDSDFIIPNLSSLQAHNACSLSGEASLQSVQMAANRYTPTASVVPTAEAASVNSSALVASHTGTAPVFRGIYRTTLTTQVIAAQTTFQYPPTPPIEGGSLEGVDKLQLQQSDVRALQPASRRIIEKELTAGVVYDKPINPFPSLPTPPDVEVMHTQSHRALSQHHHHHQQQQHQHQTASEDQTSMAKMVSPGHTPHQQWAAAQQTTNISYFMPQTSISPGESLVTYSNTGQGVAGLANVTARRVVPPAQMPALHQIYSSPHGNNSMSLSGEPAPSNMEDMLKKMPAIPALVKDGKQVILVSI